jgi:TolA-binding protein
MNTDTSSTERRPPEQDPLQNARNYLQANALRLTLTGGIVLAAIIGVTVYKARKVESDRDAAQIFTAARSDKDLETIISQHASTPYAPIAMLKLAKIRFNAGDYDGALRQYAEFKQKYPQHAMADGAEVGRIYCLEAKGQVEDALKGFAAFAAEHPNHFLAPQAIFGHARCLEQMGQYAEAKAAYEDFMAAHPDSGWAPKAEELLSLIVKKTQGKTEAGAAPVIEMPVKEKPAK